MFIENDLTSLLLSSLAEMIGTYQETLLGYLAASAKGFYPVHFLFISRRFPIPNLFPCKELVVGEGNVWLYKPDLNVMREKLQLPIGSCELALPLRDKGEIEPSFLFLFFHVSIQEKLI